MVTESSRPWKKLIWAAVLILFVGGALLRIQMLGYAPFRSDTMEFYKLALRNQNIIELWKNPPWVNQIPLNETFALLLVKAGLPPTPFIVCLPFALMGILALFFVWRFSRRWFGAGAALLTLLLAVFNPYQLYFSRTAYHYSGAVCWSAALFLAFWSIKETLQRNEAPTKKQLGLWFLAAVAACHMHMSVWVVAGLQGVLLLILGFKLKGEERARFFVSFPIGTVMFGILMLRWIIRAVKAVLLVSGEHGTGQLGASAGPEFLRLLPAYFAGENIFAIALLLIFIALAVLALFRSSDELRRFRSLAWICALHIAVLMLYVGLVGGGVAKIAYFSAVWPHFILLIGIGSYLGIRALPGRVLRIGIFVLLAGGYIALTALPDRAIIHLEGKPTPYYKINDWVLHNLPVGTPVLTDRWFEPWNELAVHNPGGINYTFTVPDEPVETYRQLNWPATVEQFFEKYPDAAFLELCPGRYEAQLGPWTFPQRYFARVASVTNDAAMVMRRFKVFPAEDYSAVNTNRVVVRIFYNTTEDLISAARRQGRDVLRLYGEGWGYAKPGWQQGRFEDYRILKQSASIDIYNLKDIALNGSLEISAATAERPKTISVNGVTTGFASGRIRTWTVPLVLQAGKNTIPFASPSADPLFVLDIKWSKSE
ncbi:MAG: hypothetical protein HOO88_07940 [Kiritimatiellaceae bacterium]|nr:hypothetical protein [Kiritimatiellaceae bacterium]